MVGMYSPVDGTYLGDLIDGTGLFNTPRNAVQGPDGNIYVSDQSNDSVFRFDISGTYIDTFIDASAGVNNIRGIDFRGTHLFVTSGDDYVAEFDDTGTRLADFINDGSDPFDILFLPDGRSLMSDIQGSTDNIRLYNIDGSFNSVIFTVDFPEQVQFDSDTDYLNAAFTDDVVTEFNLTGPVSSVSFSSGRGIYRLGNNNYLATSGSGVYELDPGTGTIITTIRSGIAAHYIELATLTVLTPTPTSSAPTATHTPPPTSTPTPGVSPTPPDIPVNSSFLVVCLIVTLSVLIGYRISFSR
jgi:hypothetical protein